MSVGSHPPARKGIVDSVLLGCIPVLFSLEQLDLFPWHWKTWMQKAAGEFVVRVGSADLNFGSDTIADLCLPLFTPGSYLC
jgi:hypothetical protein